MASDIRLILADIDGTILPYGQSVISEKMHRAFHAALDAGIHIGPASGRGYSHIPRSFGGDEALTATCLAANGMQVYLDGNLIEERLLPHEAVAHIHKLVRPLQDAGLLIFEEGLPYVLTGRLSDLEGSFPAYARTAQHMECVPDHDISKANIFVGGDLRRTQEVYAYLSERVCDLGINVPMAGFLNLTPKGWTKASGIDVLAEHLGIGLDQVVVFGDGGNDVEMLRHVPHSVTVTGAMPEALDAANHVIGRCEDDAVADLIGQIIEGRWP